MKTHSRVLAIALSLVFIPSLVGASKGPPTPTPPLPVKPQVVESYGKLPLSFEANHGQTDPQVKFLSRGRGYTLFLTPTEAGDVRLSKPLVYPQISAAQSWCARSSRSAATSRSMAWATATRRPTGRSPGR